MGNLAFSAGILILFVILTHYLTKKNNKGMITRIERLENNVMLLRNKLQEQATEQIHNGVEDIVSADPLRLPKQSLAEDIAIYDSVETDTIKRESLTVEEQTADAWRLDESATQIPSPSMDLQSLAHTAEITVPETAVPEIAFSLDENFSEHLEDGDINAEPAWSMPLLGWFMRSNILVQIGIVILFIGIGLLLKYVSDLSLLTLEMRHVAVATGGVALTGLGWFLRQKARLYGLALQGAGLGILYLTTFFAFRIYDLISAGVAFPILVALGVICAGLAVINDARVLAFMAVIGAFLAPILASNNTGSHVMLFGYYALVNGSVLAIAWFKAWRSLNLASFFFTLAAGVLWGIEKYSADLFNSTEPFVILYFAFFVLIAVLYGWRKAADPSATRIDLIDTTIVFGNPFAIFAVQSILMQPIQNGIGLTAAAMGLIYGLISILFLRRDRRWDRRWDRSQNSDELDSRSAQHPLTEAFLFLCFFFLALSVPLLFQPDVTIATWAVTGAIWVWMGTQRQTSWTRIFGLFVQLGAGVFFVQDYATTILQSAPIESIPFVNSLYIGSLLLAGSGLVSAYQLWRGKQSVGDSVSVESRAGLTNRVGRWPLVSALFMLWGLCWWFGGGIMQIMEIFLPYRATNVLDLLLFTGSSENLTPENLWATFMLFFAGSAALFNLVGRRLRWHTLRKPMLLLLPVLSLFSLIQLVYVPHHFAGLGWLIWPIVLAIYYWILCQQQIDFSQESDGEQFSGYSLGHVSMLWLITFLLTWFAGWLADDFSPNNTWMVSAVIAVLSLLILLVSSGIDRLPRPFHIQRTAYLWLGVGPIALFALGWSLLIFGTSSGDALPLRYIPLFNPLDLAHIGLFTALFVWLRKHSQSARRGLGSQWSALGFIALNLLIARTVHHTMSVPFTADALYHFAPLQMIYSITWGALALLLMFWSRRNGVRMLWGSGAIILALTIAKLFIVDLANSDSIARIISFIGVGILVMIIAYFAPAPERQNLNRPEPRSI